MKKYYFLILAFLFIPGVTVGGVITETHWDTTKPSGWSGLNYDWGLLESITCSSDSKCGSAPDPSNTLRITYKAGLTSGKSPCAIWYMLNQPVVWIQYWFKYSSNFQWEPTQNKHFYLKHPIPQGSGAPDVNNLAIFGIRGSRQRPSISIAGGGPNYYQNITSIPELNIQRDRWYKAKIYYHSNTTGTSLGGHSYSNSNGAFKVWINDVLIMDYTEVPFRRTSAFSTEADDVEHISFDPVWGGALGGTIAQDQYLYIDHTILSSTPIGSDDNTNPPTKIPSPPGKLSID